jgi:hypothetical protein
VDILLAVLPALGEADEELIRRRIGSFLEQVPRNEEGAYGDGYNLLVAAGQRLRLAAKPLFLRYLEGADPLRRYTVCQVLEVTNRDWSVELLLPFLDDKRSVGGYSHATSKDDSAKRVAIRVCDGAAETLSRNHPELKFTMIGTEQELDRQIKAMREHLARPKR